MTRIRYFIGETHGLLTVLEVIKTNRNSLLLCKCECGKITKVLGYNFRSGHTSSCGCKCAVKLKHGHSRKQSRSITYRKWCEMLSRTISVNRSNSYKYRRIYKDRGIGVCERWRSFENFLADMGECPSGLSLDRINNDKGYYPDNCRWATTSQQVLNRRVTFKVSFNGNEIPLKTACDCAGMPYASVWYRIRIKGMNAQEALTIPIGGIR